MKRKILFIVLILALAAGAVGYWKFTQKTEDVVNSKPDVVLSAADLIAAFDKDTASARRKFIDRVVQVSGMVKKIDTTGSVVLGEEGSASEVVIGIDRRHMDDLSKLKPGAPAVMQGICSGYSKGEGDDLLASLGTTVELKTGGVKEK